ncbi:MAG: hypothetical protein H7Z75_22610 [Ferruginibacter sp.]|nr:hypothetical protein [Cytophagales bacterium]
MLRKVLSLASLLSLGLAMTPALRAQVEKIKQTSHENAQERSSSGRSSSSASTSFDDGSGGNWGFGAWLIGETIGQVANWQAYKLRKRFANPSVVSLEIMPHLGINPPDYYLAMPRVRGNWGLFSTDFRYNLLIEPAVEGYRSFRTLDWQILQLNLVTTRPVTFRVGTGFSHESAARRAFHESTFALEGRLKADQLGWGAEYRVSKDYETGAVPRREFGVRGQYQVWERGKTRGYLMLGGFFQRYYGRVNVGGIQGGITLVMNN